MPGSRPVSSSSSGAISLTLHLLSVPPDSNSWQLMDQETILSSPTSERLALVSPCRFCPKAALSPSQLDADPSLPESSLRAILRSQAHLHLQAPRPESRF